MSKRYKISIPVDYVAGYLRYGHIEAEISEEAYQRFKEGKDLYEEDLYNKELIVDDYEVNSYGDIDWDNLEVLKGDV